MYAAFCGSKNERVHFTLPTKALPMGLPILQEGRKKRQKGEENPTNNSNRDHTEIIPNTLVNVLLKKTTATKPQDLKYKPEVVNNQERGFEEGWLFIPPVTLPRHCPISWCYTRLFPGSIPGDKRHSHQALGHSLPPPRPS